MQINLPHGIYSLKVARGTIEVIHLKASVKPRELKMPGEIKSVQMFYYSETIH